MDAFKITLKDLRLLFRDRRALVILVAMPMVIIAIVGSSTGRLRANREQSRQGLTIEVDDFDQSVTSKRLAGFLASYDNVLVRSGDVTDRTDASLLKQLQDERPTDDIDMRLVIQPGFENHMRQLSTTVLTSPDETTRKNGFGSVNLTLVSNETADDPMMDGLAKTLVKLSLQNAILPILAEKVPSFRGAARDSVIPEPWESSVAAKELPSDTGNRVYQFFIPSYTVLFVFFLVNIMGRSFIGERDTGTLRRLRISPIAPIAILIGKTLPFLIVSLVQTVTLMISGRLLFGMSWGPEPLLLIPIMLCTSSAATSLGLMFSTIAKTESQVSSFGNLILLSSAGISGCLVPRAWMPPITQKISLFTPHAWALDAYGEVLTRDLPRISVIAQSCGMLLLFSSVFFVVGLYRFQADA
ncbi:MAG TPA: ABC transporter permease [Planctomycetaceae bacterium]|nr:ABC transporter permease [Planctomycetaceae bacterium]